LPPELFLLAQICTKSFVGWGFAPDPTGRAYSAPPDPLAGLRGPTSKGGEGRGAKGSGGKGREGKESAPLDLNPGDATVRRKLHRKIENSDSVNNNNIYFAKGQVQQKGKSPSKLATILRATQEKKQQKRKTTLQTFR